MLTVCLAPKPSKWCAACLWVLHAALLWVVLMHWSSWQQIWTLSAIAISVAYSVWQWRRSAAYTLNIISNDKVLLQWQQQEPVAVVRVTGGLVSHWVLVAVWQDARNRRYQTVLWPDSVGKREFKMAYVWLRWQPVPHEKEKQ